VLYTKCRFSVVDRVGAFVRRPPVTAAPEATILDVVKLMAAHNIGLVVVVEEGGRPVGVVSERDVVRALARGVELTEKALNVGTRGDLLTARPDEEVYSVVKKMQKQGTRHILVVDDVGRLVGVVSIRDLVEDRALRAIGDRVWRLPQEGRGV